MVKVKKITREELDEILKVHRLWLNGIDEGKKADLNHVKLRGMNLWNESLRHVDLSYADLSHADLCNVDLRDANLYNADLSHANLSCVNLIGADLRCANLEGVKLSSVDLSHADLSGAKRVESNIDFLDNHFEKTNEGYIVYKTFGDTFAPPANWNIEKGSVLRENVNFNRTENCGCGINVAPLDWVRQHYKGTIWKCLIPWEWLAGVCCPYNSDGKIRCERIKLIEPVKTEREHKLI